MPISTLELNKGLRSDSRTRKNSGQLIQATNLKLTQDNLEPETVFDDPYNGGQTVTWPYPQFFKGKGVTLVATSATALSSAAELDPWTLTSLTTYDALDPDTTKAIPVGASNWQLADFQDTWMLCNSREVVFEGNIFGRIGETEKVLISDAVQVTSVCAHKGRGFLAGFSTSNFWQDKWSDFWSEATSTLPYQTDTTTNVALDQNFVWWTSLAGGDLFALWFPDEMMDGYEGFHQGFQNKVFEMLKRNDFGYAPMPYQGLVRRVAPLGDHVIAYSNDGIASLTPTTIGDFNTMGVRLLSDHGIMTGHAFCASPKRHIWLDNIGDLWQITPDLQVTRLGYKEYLLDFDNSTAQQWSYDSQEDQFWICDGNEGYILTESGLTQTMKMPTSAQVVGDDIRAVTDDANGEFLNTPCPSGQTVIVTDVYDFGERTNKTIRLIEVGTTKPIEVAVDYRSNTGDFKRSLWKKTDDYGRTYFVVSGVEFRIVLRGDDSTQYEYITVEWEPIQKRRKR